MTTPGIEAVEVRLTHIESGFDEVRTLIKSTNERVDQIYNHLLNRQQNSSNQKASWKQWAGATVLSLLALVVALWDRVSTNPS